MSRYTQKDSITIEIENPSSNIDLEDAPDYDLWTEVEVEIEYEDYDEDTNGGGYWTVIGYEVLSPATWVTEKIVSEVIDRMAGEGRLD